jgi:hypothetical protein
MAVREFDGTDDKIVLDDGSLGAFAAGAHTMVLLVKPTSLSDVEFYLAFNGGGTDIAAVMSRSSGNIEYASTRGDQAMALGVSASAWQIIAISRAAGTVVCRGHRKVLGSGSWTHANSGGALGTEAADCDTIEMGCIDSSLFMPFRGAMMALFTSELSDGAIESIDTNASTAFVDSLGPAALWDLNQADVATDVLDLVGTAHETSVVGTTVVTGDDPAWTFGLVTEVPVVIPDYSNFPREMLRRV